MADKIEVTFDQSDVERWFQEVHGTTRWTVLYQTTKMGDTGINLFSYLMPPERCKQALTEPSWDLPVGNGGPGYSVSWADGEKVTIYHRIGEPGSIEPIVFVRHFPHGRPDSLEISEDLRLLFNLYEDQAKGVFYEAEDDGSETEVARVRPGKVEMRTSFLRRYLAARQLALVLQIDSDYWLTLQKGEATPVLPAERVESDEHLRTHFYAGDVRTDRLFSRYLGKKLIPPPQLSESGLWPYESAKEYLSFIIGEDDQGKSIEHTCDPDTLANYFGKNPEAPHYLTSVFFDREVLRRYYENSDRYTVEDGVVQRHGLWHLRLDNNHSDHVAVFLGDLGRDIPTSEQRHWRAYNLPPEERTLSGTAIRRSFLGQFADADLIEHAFKQAYHSANNAWSSTFGWPLFKELHADDAHVLSSLRLPLGNTANEFDSQLLDLVKLLVDSLNEEQIVGSLTTSTQGGDKGIAKFERLLTEKGYPNVGRDMVLLRTIQGIRSKGTAHRKGSDYDLTRAGLDPNDFQKSFLQLLTDGTQMLTDLETYVKARNQE